MGNKMLKNLTFTEIGTIAARLKYVEIVKSRNNRLNVDGEVETLSQIEMERNVTV